MHVPREVVSEALAVVSRINADCCVAIGGGSTTGLAKAIALSSQLPIVCIPTTYAGSEMTPIWGITENNLKSTGRDLRVLPKTVIYDPELTLTMPVMMSVTSGMNAIAHCVEALYSKDANPVVSKMAEEGIRAMAHALPGVVRSGNDIQSRSEALSGAWLAGISLGAVGMALHHKLCHTLGGTFQLPHAETHTVILPHAIAYNSAAAPEAMAITARALGAPSAAPGLFDLATSLGAPTSLEALGMKEADLPQAAALATQSPYPNPAPLTYDGILTLLRNAFHGIRPA